MTQTIAHLVNRLVIDSDDGFDEVRQRYESLLPATDFAELTRVIKTGNPMPRAAALRNPPAHSSNGAWRDPTQPWRSSQVRLDMHRVALARMPPTGLSARE